MEELIERLKKTCEDIELITELTLKYNDAKVVSDMLLYKKIEDGILSNLHTANNEQLRILRNSYKFSYYGKEITDKLVDAAILKNSRREKLKKINHAKRD
jgi:hypothetical protein